MYGVKWVYFDLDGTLTSDGYSITNRTFMAISYLKSKGIKVGISTGRSYFFTEHIAKNIGIDLPLICVNGAWILRKDNFVTIKEETISLETQTEILRMLNSNNIDYMVYTTEGVYSTDPDLYFFKKLEGMRPHLKTSLKYEFEVLTNRSYFKDLRILKLMICYKDSEEKNKLISLIKTFDNISYTSSQKNVIDIYNKNSDKSEAIKWIMGRNGIKNHELMVFGDNENDIRMFQLTNKSVALENSPEKVKRYAKFVTEYPCNEEGVADFIFRNF